MNARPAAMNRGQRDLPLKCDQHDQNDEPAADPSQRVMSVSARAANIVSERTHVMTATAEGAENMLLSPRVIDQNAFDDLAGTLRNLIDNAENVGRGLEQCVKHAGGVKQEQDKSAEQLQERLRLSARMLKAFQSQIVRTESAIAELTSREEHFFSVEQQAEHAVESMKKRIDGVIDTVMDRFQQQLEERITAALERMDREIDARVNRLQIITDEVDALAPALDRLNEVAEHAEVSVVSKAYRAAELVVDLVDRGRAIEELIARSKSASTRLEDELLVSALQIDELNEQSGLIGDRLEAACQRGESTHEVLSQQIEAAHIASRELSIDVQACEALETLLEELKPWQGLTLDRDVEADDGEVKLPEPAARLVDELRRRLDRDLEDFSSVLAQVAEQFQRFASREHVRREATELDAHDDRGGSNVIPAPDGGDEGVVSVITPASSLSFSSHARTQSR